MNWGRRATLVPTAASLLLMVACSGTGESTPPRSRPPAATSSVNPGSVRGGSWVTYHGDKTRSGVARGPSIQNVQRTWTSPGLDGDIYAEPLTIGSRVIAATENDSVYALDASNGRVVWRTNLGTPVQSSTLPCGNISPTSGITSTPVADPSTGLIYAAAFLSPGRHELFALRERTGEVVWHRPIDPQGMDPLTQQLRSALTLANGRVYMAYGGLFGDCGDYHGWVAAVAADGTGPLLDYQVPTGNAGGIWAPSGPAVDDAGNLYVATGNSFSNGTFDFGDSVIKLSPELQRLDFFAPANWAELDAGDVDLGSVGPAVLAGDRIFQIGKEGVGYLLDASALGGIGGELHAQKVCEGSFGGTAATVDRIYIPCTDGVVALTVAEDARSFSPLWRSATFDAGPPIVAGGVIWTIDLSAGALVGLNEANGHELVREKLEEVSHFASPSSAAGCLFVPTLQTITAFCTTA
jgi:outer membrane protein assembly factor BamB